MNGTLEGTLRGWQQRAFAAAVVGLILCAAGAYVDVRGFVRSYLFAYAYWTGMSIGCLAILLLHHTVHGKWGAAVRRPCEAAARLIPYFGVLLLPVLAAMPLLYVWALPEAAGNPALQRKAAYLNVPFFIVRSIVYFVVWSFYAYRLSRWSTEQDRTGDPRLIERMRALSAPGLLVFTFVSTFAFVDWIMSLEPEWFSTMYGVMFLVGETLEAFALTIAVVIALSHWEPLRTRLTDQHLHDLGNLLLAITVLWAYLSFSQFLIIWSGNLPEEIPWYVRRLGQGWGWVASSLVVFHFFLPFLLLLPRAVKRRKKQLLGICLLMLAIRMVDVFWVVEPAFRGAHVQVVWTDLAAPLFLGGLWLGLFFRQLGARPLMPVRDATLEGAPRETVAF